METNDLVHNIKKQVIMDAIAPLLPKEILMDEIDHGNGIVVRRIEAVVLAVLTWYDAKFSLRQVIHILKLYLTNEQILQVVAFIADDVDTGLRVNIFSHN